MADDYAAYVEARYQGEVFGEAVFEAMAKAREDAGEARKLRVLAQLERETKEALLPAVEETGRSTVPDTEQIEKGRRIGEQMGQAPWRDFVAGMRPELVKLVAEFGASESLADGERRELLRHVTAHEQALLDFADLELSEDPAEDSLRPVLALLR